MLIALMLEGAVSHVLSLNFDLAPQNAAVELGAEVTVIDRPEGIPMTKAVVHLHGSVNSANDDWVLRAEVIDDAWRAKWQEVVARQILAAPIVMFAGLGSAAPVLTETVAMIAGAVAGKAFFQVDIGDHAGNGFAQQLGITADRYVRGSWCEVMSQLGQHLASEQIHTFAENGAAVIAENGGSDEDIRVFRELVDSLNEVSLLDLGRFRAHARLSRRSHYQPRGEQDEEWMAMPLKTLADIAAHTGMRATPTSTGVWHLRRRDRASPQAQVLIVTGRGSRKLSALESDIRVLSRSIEQTTGWGPDLVLVGGVVPDSSLANLTAPSDIVGGEESLADIITGPRNPYILSIDSTRVVQEAKGWLNAA